MHGPSVLYTMGIHYCIAIDRPRCREGVVPQSPQVGPIVCIGGSEEVSRLGRRIGPGPGSGRVGLGGRLGQRWLTKENCRAATAGVERCRGQTCLSRSGTEAHSSFT